MEHNLEKLSVMIAPTFVDLQGFTFRRRFVEGSDAGEWYVFPLHFCSHFTLAMKSYLQNPTNLALPDCESS